MPSRESQREELDRLAGFEGQDAGYDNPLWDGDLGQFYVGGGLYLTRFHPRIKRLIKAGKLEEPPE